MGIDEIIKQKGLRIGDMFVPKGDFVRETVYNPLAEITEEQWNNLLVYYQNLYSDTYFNKQFMHWELLSILSVVPERKDFFDPSGKIMTVMKERFHDDIATGNIPYFELAMFNLSYRQEAISLNESEFAKLNQNMADNLEKKFWIQYLKDIFAMYVLFPERQQDFPPDSTIVEAARKNVQLQPHSFRDIGLMGISLFSIFFPERKSQFPFDPQFWENARDYMEKHLEARRHNMGWGHDDLIFELAILSSDRVFIDKQGELHLAADEPVFSKHTQTLPHVRRF